MSKPDFAWPALDQAETDALDVESRRQKAVDEGYAAGHASGLAAAESELNDHYRKLAQTLAELEHQCSWLAQSNADALHDMVGSVLSAILDVELSSDAQIYRRFLEQGLKSLAATPPKLQCNSDTLARLRALDVQSDSYELDVEESLADGAIRLATTESIVEFDPKSELQRLLDESNPSDVEESRLSPGTANADEGVIPPGDL